MKHFKMISCRVLFREVSLLAAKLDASLDITWLKYGYHNLIGELHGALQAEIDLIESGNDTHTTYPPVDGYFDAILIGYGLCSNGIIGLKSEKYPLVIPRAHDCITLLLGSKDRYRELFDSHPGTIWYTPGWMENSTMPTEYSREALIQRFEETYGRELAEEMADMDEDYLAHYDTLGIVQWPEFTDAEFIADMRSLAQNTADFTNWNVNEYSGDSHLLHDLVAGNWDDERFLVVPPGYTVKATVDERIIEAVPV